MADYSKMKNAELEALLKQRGLPHTGKKAEMVARLQEADKKAAVTPSAPAAEDEIDWDDDATAEAAKPTAEAAKPAVASASATAQPAEPAAIKPEASSEAGAAAMAAGGKGRVPNPQAVPNQEPAIDPTATAELSAAAPGDEPAATASAEPAEDEKKQTKPPVDFSRGLAATTLEEELEKRKARAKKFGIPENDEDAEEAMKRLERAKKFGETGGPKGLNEALPERRERKRGRDAQDDGRRGNNKRGPGRRFDRRRGGGGNRPDGGRADRPAGGTWMSETDRAKAEARKARFAAAT